MSRQSRPPARAGPRPRRRLAQHFLSDPRILARIAEALGPTPRDTVVEIGPGTGGLTVALAERAGRVIAIEKDPALVPAVRARVPSAVVIEADARDLDWAALAGAAPESGGPVEHYLVAGNIPYNITSSLLEKALEPPRPARIVFLVQREVAERVGAAPGTREYGALSVGVQAVAAVEVPFRVAAGAFSPRPRVDSAVLRLTPFRAPLVREAEREAFRRLVVGLFGFRRKQLGRAVRELTGWEPGRVSAAVGAAGLDERARPEALAPAEFVRLLRALVDAGWGGE